MSDNFLNTREACKVVGLSRQELWRRRRAGTFPQPVRLGGRRVGYVAAEVQAWISQKMAERDSALAERKESMK